jgi:FkbM family methyltransferase
LPACEAEPERPKSPLELGPKRYSQHDEELVIRHFFGDRRDGFFLDVGAYHWQRNSTTLYLEKHLGWSGISIDALERFRAGYEENRPRTHFFSYIVSDRSGELATIYVADALSSVNQDHLDSFSTMREQIDKIEPKPLQVPTITLTDLLEREKVERIDFLSMDIEGHEPTALAGFDIERFRPELVCIEIGDGTSDRITAYFEEHGYERIDAYRAYDPVNGYFRQKQGSL